MIKLEKGDSLELIKSLKDKSVDLILTDPPYGINKEGILNDSSLDMYYRILPDCYRVLKDNTFFVTFASIGRLPDFFKNNPFTYRWQYLIYINNGMGRGGIGFNRYISTLIFQKGNAEVKRPLLDIFECSTSSKQKEYSLHPTEKRLDAVLKLVNSLSNVSDTVLDPFMGSGTIGEASIKLRRNFIGYELDDTYFKRARKRMSSVGVVLNENGNNLLEDFEVEE